MDDLILTLLAYVNKIRSLFELLCFSETRTVSELTGRAKGDARKVHVARRLRVETAVTLKWLASVLHIGD